MLENLISWAGLPLFVYLLLRSRLHYTWRKRVEWKGRTYEQPCGAGPGEAQAPVAAAPRR